MTPDSQRKQVIPFAAWVIASIILVAMYIWLHWLILHDHNVPLAVLVLVSTVPPLAMAGWTLLIGYVYGDARRRGMRYVMWTLLAIFIPNGIGVILYFILRDPIPCYCSKCGSPAKPGHAFCPGCGANILPACPQCQRAGQPGWSHCAWCGAKL
jgi:Double zinc ribbon